MRGERRTPNRQSSAASDSRSNVRGKRMNHQKSAISDSQRVVNMAVSRIMRDETHKRQQNAKRISGKGG